MWLCLANLLGMLPDLGHLYIALFLYRLLGCCAVQDMGGVRMENAMSYWMEKGFI